MLLPPRRSKKRSKHAAAVGTLSGKRGRPVKPPSALEPPRAEKKLRQKLLRDQELSKMTVEKQGLSALENLPIEIIQHIFFWCLEPALANTSLTINQALSHESIYRAVLLFAYFDASPKLPVEVALFRPAEFRHVSVRARCYLQKAMLKCKWCTFDRIKAAMPALSRLAMMQKWHEEHRVMQGAGFTNEQNFVVGDQALAAVAQLPSIDDDDGVKNHFLAQADQEYWQEYYGRSWAIAGDNGFLPFITFWSWTPDGDGSVHKYPNGAETVLGVRHIPDWLLKAPRTPEDLEFLMLLRQGMRYINNGHILDISVEALFRGMEVAITGDYVARPSLVLMTLLELWCHLFGASLDRREKLPATRPLPIKLFHLAAQHNDSIMMESLIRADIDSVPSDDDVLTGWALRMRAKLNPIGDWLLDYMTHRETGVEDGLLFNNGALSWRRREGFYPFPESSFTEEVMYMQERAVSARSTAPDGRPLG